MKIHPDLPLQLTAIDATDNEKTLALDYLVRNGTDTAPANVLTMIEAIRKKNAGQ